MDLNSSLIRIFDQNDKLGIVIYDKENILYTNRGFNKIINLPLKNLDEILIKLKIEYDIFEERIYNNFPIHINNEIKNLCVCICKIHFANKEAFLATFIDNSKEKILAQYFHIIRNLYNLSYHSFTEEDFFDQFATEIINNDFSSCMVFKKEKNTLKLITIKDKNNKNIKNIKNFHIEILKECQNDTLTKAIETKTIQITNNVKKNCNLDIFQNTFLENSYKSGVAIPILKNNEIHSVVCICIDKEDYFKSYCELLNEIQKLITYTLEYIEKIALLNIIKTSIDYSDQWFVVTDENAYIEYANEMVEKISKYKLSELIGKKPNVFKSGYHDNKFYQQLWNTIKKGKIFNAVIINKDKNGDVFYLKDKIIPVKIKNTIKFISIAIDITKERKLLDDIEKLKHTDKLTNLINKEAFINEIDKIIKTYSDNEHYLILIDIDKFSAINNIVGFENGNLILIEIAERLKHIFSNHIIARVGSDEFGILLTNSTKDEFFQAVNEIKNIFNKKFRINKHETIVNFNAGISIYPYDASNAFELFAKASFSLNIAKQNEENIKIFENKYIDEVEEYIKIIGAVRLALKEKRIDLYFQPYVDTKTEKIVGAESLIRIYDKNNPIILPSKFIETLETSELINEVALYQLKLLKKAIKATNLRIAFNLTTKNFYNEKLKQEIYQFSKHFKDKVTFEVTETIAIKEFDNITEYLNSLRKNSSLIAIDDFGTGYSSLTYLETLPADIIKIDISFVRNMLHKKIDYEIVKTVINLSNILGLKTVAEGVETKEQYELLKELGCTYIQGYYFYKPMPLDELLKVLKG